MEIPDLWTALKSTGAGVLLVASAFVFERLVPGRFQWAKLGLALIGVAYAWLIVLLLIVLAVLLAAWEYFERLTGRDRIARTPQEFAALLRSLALEESEWPDDDWMDLTQRTTDPRLEDLLARVDAAWKIKDTETRNAEFLRLADEAQALAPSPAEAAQMSVDAGGSPSGGP